MLPVSTPIYRFDEFRLNPARHELWRGDQELTLPLKAFSCLVYLVEHRDRAVGREELIDAVWHKENLADSVLSQAIVEARRALDDNGGEPRYIQTVRGFGYRWAAPVETVEQPVEAAETAAEVSPRRGRKVLSLRLFLATLAVGLLVAGAIYLWRRAHPTTAEGPRVQLAAGDIGLLLPVSVDAADRHPWIRLGVMDLMTARLRAAGQPMVPSDTVIALLRDHSTDPDPKAIDRLSAISGARLVLGAQAEAANEHWRVSLRTLRGPRPPLNSFGESNDVLEAARIAADRMALALGRAPAPEPNAEPGLDTLLKQSKAAMLAQQMDVARELIETADAELRQHPKVRLQLAQIDSYGHNLDAAQASCESLRQDLAAEADPELRASVLHCLGTVHLRRGDDAAAEPILEEALRLLRNSGQEEAIAVLGRIQMDLGTIAASSGDMEAARERLAWARLSLENTGDVLSLAVLIGNLGVLEALRERYGEAVHYMDRAADLHAAMHNVGNELRTRANMVEAHLGLLEPQVASALEPRLNELLAQTSNPALTIHGNSARSALLAAHGRSRAATSVLAEVLKAIEARNDLPPAAPQWALVQRAEQLAREGDLERAARVAARVVEQVPPHDNALLDDYLGRARLVLLRAHLTERDFGGASEISTAMSARAEHGQTRGPKVYAALAEAELAAAQGRGAAAETAFEHALALADSGHVPLHLLEVTESYVPWLLRAGLRGIPDPDRAVVVADRLARYAEQDYRAALLLLRVWHAVGYRAAWRTALGRARSLAGERQIPQELLTPPQTPYLYDENSIQTRRNPNAPSLKPP